MQLDPRGRIIRQLRAEAALNWNSRGWKMMRAAWEVQGGEGPPPPERMEMQTGTGEERGGRQRPGQGEPIWAERRVLRIMGQLEKRAKAAAPDWSNRGGAAHNTGQEHPERHQDTGRRPPGLQKPGGAQSQEEANDRTG